MVKQKRKEKAGKWDVPLPKGITHYYSLIMTHFYYYSSRTGRGRSIQNGCIRKKKEKSMETNGMTMTHLRLITNDSF